MTKFNEVKTKRGVDLAEHLVAYYQAQEEYFQDGNLIMKALKSWEEKFTTQCSEVSICPHRAWYLTFDPSSSNEPSRTMSVRFCWKLVARSGAPWGSWGARRRAPPRWTQVSVPA